MSLNTNRATIPDFPYGPLLKQLLGTEETTPHVRGVAPKMGLHERTCGEVPCFVNSVEQRMSPMDESPRLLGQHRKVKSMNIMKAHPTTILRSAQLAPVDPVNFPLISSLSPPILSQHRVNILTHLLRKLENTHRLNEYCLGHRLYQHLPTCLRDCFFLPPHHPFCYPLL